jgi:hypothetical protein
MPENDESKEQCPFCGEECKESDLLTCPFCAREGCESCMPAGKNCSCPECEDEEDA